MKWQALVDSSLTRHDRLLFDADEASSIPPFPLEELSPYDAKQAPSKAQQPPAIDIFSERRRKRVNAASDPWLGDLDSNLNSGWKKEDPLSTFPLASDLNALPPHLQLPRDLRAALIGAVSLAVAHRVAATSSSSSSLSVGSSLSLYTYEQVTEMMDWVMDRADVLKPQVLSVLKSKYGGGSSSFRLEDLEFTVCIAPAVDEVLSGEKAKTTRLKQMKGEEGQGSSVKSEGEGRLAIVEEKGLEEAMDGPSSDLGQGLGQSSVLRAALLLWLWLDVKCCALAGQVRSVGGLLVIGTSMQESKRVELQLCGRAGRQGDPGQTLMIYDFADPLVSVYGGDWTSTLSESFAKTDAEALAAARARGDAAPPPIYLEGKMVDAVVGAMRKTVETSSQMARLEMKRFDEVVETYRRNIYSLRRLVLLGSSHQRTQVVYVFIQ